MERLLQTTVALLIGLLLSLAWHATANAQGVGCGKHDTIVAALKSNYQEERRAIALAATAGVVELYVSPAGTWSMVVTTPNGITCIAAAGKAWQALKPVAPVGPET